jgi:hypothetical protein
MEDKYQVVSLEGLTDMQQAVVDSVIHEGEMRQSEKIVELIERKITEAYANDNRELIDFLESLILEIENI